MTEAGITAAQLRRRQEQDTPYDGEASRRTARNLAGLAPQVAEQKARVGWR